MTQTVYSKEMIREMLETRDAAVVKGVMAIYQFQTASEQSTQTTNEDNGIGFNGVDAQILSAFAVSAAKYGTFTPKMMVIARKKMLKYAGQLAKIANNKVGVAA